MFTGTIAYGKGNTVAQDTGCLGVPRSILGSLFLPAFHVVVLLSVFLVFYFLFLVRCVIVSLVLVIGVVVWRTMVPAFEIVVLYFGVFLINFLHLPFRMANM